MIVTEGGGIWRGWGRPDLSLDVDLGELRPEEVGEGMGWDRAGVKGATKAWGQSLDFAEMKGETRERLQAGSD